MRRACISSKALRIKEVAKVQFRRSVAKPVIRCYVLLPPKVSRRMIQHFL
jgi:hypothetical protein